MAKTKQAPVEQAEKPKRIFKETIDVEVVKTGSEIQADKEALQELVLKRFEHEQAIEKAKKAIANLKRSIERAQEDAESLTREEEREVIVKVYAKSMRKEFWYEDKLIKEEEAERWDLQADIDDLNADENMAEINGEEDED